MKRVNFDTMKILADHNIPHVSHFFSHCGEITYFPGEKITRALLHDVDILLVRTVTKIDRSLLENTSVQFVGSATTGVDHIDTDWLLQNGIALATSVGANTQAVTEYVAYCLDALKKEGQLHDKKIAGIIGCGRIGSKVAALLESLGFMVFCYDPLLTEKKHFQFVSFEKILSEADIISIHTPLTKTGLYPTYHLLNETQLKKIKPNTMKKEILRKKYDAVLRCVGARTSY